MSKTRRKPPPRFQRPSPACDCFASDPTLRDCEMIGLQGLKGEHRSLVADGDRAACSVNVDTCLKNEAPTEPRWDYVIVTHDKVGIAMEVHPSNDAKG